MKAAKLTKLKSALKKLPSLTNRTSTRNPAAADRSVPDHLHPVYVGKSRRRYLVSPEVISHPLFQVLVDKSDGSDGATVVACEVVMFDHLLWMLQNSADSQLGSMDELVEYYTSC